MHGCICVHVRVCMYMYVCVVFVFCVFMCLCLCRCSQRLFTSSFLPLFVAVCSFPCQNGGTCVGPNECRCTPQWTGIGCVIRKLYIHISVNYGSTSMYTHTHHIRTCTHTQTLIHITNTHPQTHPYTPTHPHTHTRIQTHPYPPIPTHPHTFIYSFCCPQLCVGSLVSLVHVLLLILVTVL